MNGKHQDPPSVMPSNLDIRTQQLRAQIARSRRRLDQRARRWIADARQLVVARSVVSLARDHCWLVRLAVGLAVARWLLGGRVLEDLRQGMGWEAAASWLSRLARRLRVLAWYYRRSTSRRPAESDHE